MGSRVAEFQSAQVFALDHVLLPDISYTSFTYPGDQEALATLKGIPGAARLLAYIQEQITEQMVLVQNNEQMLRAGPRSFGSIHKLLLRCSEVLSLHPPDVYITQNPVMNAYTVGHRKTCIVLHSALIEGLTADELSFVIGHELGHIKCGHGLYRQLGDLLLQYWDAVAAQLTIPGVGLIRIPLLLAYWEWYRRAEHTCDRAGLLCGQQLEPSLRALVKLAGKVSGFEDEIDLESAIDQSHVHREVNKVVRVISILENVQNTHPFVPSRLRELKSYAEGPAYRQILSGSYDRDVRHLHEGGERVDCPRCKSKINSTLDFCHNCGFDLRAIAASPGQIAECACQACGIPIDKDCRFCPKCGAPQTTALPPPPPPPPSGFDKMKSNLFGKR